MGRKQLATDMCNMQAQLNYLGVRLETISKLKFNEERSIDTIGIDYVNVLKDLDAQQNCNKYEWTGKFTEEIQSWLLEFMLYRCGTLAGFESGGKPYILPFAQADGINIVGIPNAVQPITFNGAMGADPNSKRFASKTYNVLKENGACILYDKIPTYSTNSKMTSRFGLNDNLIRYQAEILGRIKNNLKNLDKKVVFYVESEAQKRQMENDIRDAYGTDDPFIVAVRGTQVTNKDNTTLQGDISNETQSLFETWQSLNSIRCMCSGISNGGAFEKKERVITGELSNEQPQTQLVLDAGLKMRKLFIKQMQKIYPNSEWWKDADVKINIEQSEINMNTLQYENDQNIEEGGDTNE